MSIDHPATIGLRAASLEEWLRPRAGDDAVLRQRRQLIESAPHSVLACTADAAPAVSELAGVLSGRDQHALHGDSLALLSQIGQVYAEDIVVLTPSGSAYVVSAAVLCFPNRWRLADKVGRPLLAVHAPVPDYAGRLADQVDFFLSRLRPMRYFVRSNWGLASVPDMHLPNAVAPVNLSRDGIFFVRQEYQGFVKLPSTSAVIFTIRTTVTPWADVPPDDRAAILAQCNDLSPEWRAYKSITG